MEIPIIIDELNNGKVLKIKIKVNNIDSIFLLDTGASTSIIDKRKLSKYTSKSPVISDRISGVGNDFDSYTIEINNVILGNKKIEYVNFIVSDLLHLNNTFSTNNIETIDGILGNDIIFNIISTIDIKNNLVIID